MTQQRKILPPLGTARPLPTTYRGCRFRSRLEARWAVLGMLGACPAGPLEFDPPSMLLRRERLPSRSVPFPLDRPGSRVGKSDSFLVAMAGQTASTAVAANARIVRGVVVPSLARRSQGDQVESPVATDAQGEVVVRVKAVGASVRRIDPQSLGGDAGPQGSLQAGGDAALTANRAEILPHCVVHSRVLRTIRHAVNHPIRLHYVAATGARFEHGERGR